MTGQTTGAPPVAGAPYVSLVRRSLSGALSSGFNFWTPSGFSITDPMDIATAGERAAVFSIRAADLAVAGKTTQLRSRLTVQTNGTAPGVDFRVRVFGATFAGSTSTFTVSSTTEVDSSPVITAPAANSLSTSQSAGVVLPSDGLYVWYLWLSAGPAASRQLVEVDLQAYWV